MARQVLIGTAVIIALCLGWLAWGGWSYLQRGYSLGLSMNGHARSIFHIEFPAWRAAIHVSQWVAEMAATVAYVTSLRWASTAAWLTFAATLLVGTYDVTQYGIIGSPTSIWNVLLLLLFALLTAVRPLAPREKT
ncbi:MAG TPA: hypothetical protein VF727_02790 [Allosphingosinicella sp.]